MSQICLPLGIDKQEIVLFEALVEASATKRVGEIVFRQGEPFKKVYAIKSGALKSSRVDEFGHEHVLGFHLPGELVGLDGIYANEYSCQTRSLDTTVLCEMDYEKLSELCISVPSLQQQLLRLLSREIFDSHVTNTLNATQTAIQKIASFLSNLSVRYEMRGYSADEFKLAMSRQDIASHLGLTPETVSRTLKTLKQDHVIELNGRHIRLLNTDKLNAIVACSAP